MVLVQIFELFSIPFFVLVTFMVFNRLLGFIGITFATLFATTGCRQKEFTSTNDPSAGESLKDSSSKGVAISNQKGQDSIPTDLVTLEDINEQLIDGNFALASKTIEKVTDPGLLASLKLLVDILRLQQHLYSSGGVVDASSMNEYIKTTRTLQTRFNEINPTKPSKETQRFPSDYAIAIAALSHLSCIEDYASVYGYSPDIQEEFEHTFIEDSFFLSRVALEAIISCLKSNPQDANANLLYALFQIKAKSELGPDLLVEALKRGPNDYFALLLLLKNWNEPLIARNADCAQCIFVALGRDVSRSLKLIGIARNKHAVEYIALNDAYRNSILEGDASMLLLGWMTDSKIVLSGCDLLVSHLDAIRQSGK